MRGFRSHPPDFNREVNEAYLDFIRRQPCLVWGCTGAADAHHLITRGAGGSDLCAVPLCREHHSEIHLVGRVRFEEDHNLALWEQVAILLADYVRQLELPGRVISTLGPSVLVLERTLEPEDLDGIRGAGL